MSKFKVGDKVVVVDSQSVGNYYKNGDKGIVSSVEHKLHGYVTRDDGVEMNVYWTEIGFEKETEMALTSTMNVEQIRDEIIRIDLRIEEAKKDIENAEKERNSLVEKLREKGFELTNHTTNNLPCQKLTEEDTVRILSYNKEYHPENYTNHSAKIIKTDSSYRPYLVKVGGSVFWCTPEEVEKI